MRYVPFFLLLVLCSCSTASRVRNDAYDKSNYRPVMGEVTTIQTTVPEVSGLCAAPAGDGMLAASDDNGVYHVAWDGTTTEFFNSHMDCEGVTIDPETKDVYFIVERRQEVRRLKSPGHNDSELLTTIKDVGYRTNSGLEGVTFYKDGTVLVGNQANPVLLMCYSPKEDKMLWQKELDFTSEIADLYYDSVRDMLWVADSERHEFYLCTAGGEKLATYPMPDIDNGEGLFVDHANGCIWIGDDTTSKIYRISFKGL